MRNSPPTRGWRRAVSRRASRAASGATPRTLACFVNGCPLVGAEPFEAFEWVIALAEEGTLGDAYRRAG